jgi:hypothetical protein
LSLGKGEMSWIGYLENKGHKHENKRDGSHYSLSTWVNLDSQEFFHTKVFTGSVSHFG